MTSFYLKKAFGKKNLSGYSANVVLAARFSEMGRSCLKAAYESCRIKGITFIDKPADILDSTLDYIDDNEYYVVAGICENIMDMTLLKGREIVYRKSIPKGTSDIVWNIQSFVRKEYKAVLSDKLATDIFYMVRSNAEPSKEHVKIRCRDLISGCPKEYRISIKEIEEVIENGIFKLNDFMHMFFSELSKQNILEKEITERIQEKGVIYSGILFPLGSVRIRDMV